MIGIDRVTKTGHGREIDNQTNGAGRRGGAGWSVSDLIQPHGHRADERLDARCALVVGRAESPADVLVVEHLNLEREVLLEVLEDHHEKRELDPKGLVGVGGAGNEGRRNVSADDLQDGGLDVLVRDTLDVPITNLLVPNLQRFRAVCSRGGGGGEGGGGIGEQGRARKASRRREKTNDRRPERRNGIRNPRNLGRFPHVDASHRVRSSCLTGLRSVAPPLVHSFSTPRLNLVHCLLTGSSPSSRFPR